MSESLFRAWDVFLLRAPVAAGRPAPAAACDHLDLLRAAAEDPLLSEAIALATPSLSRVLDRVAAGRTDGLKPAQLRRAALAVRRYDIRLRTRPTPFGVFAGVSAGLFDDAAKFRDGERHRTRTHADMQWLIGVVHELEADPTVVPDLTVRAHSSLRTRGDRVVLDCPTSLGDVPGGPEARVTVSVRHSAPVAAVLAGAREPVHVTGLVDRVAVEFGAPRDRVTGLVGDLVAQELLVTGLRPPLDGGDPLRHVIDVLGRTRHPGSAATTALGLLREIDEARARYDAVPPGAGRAELDRTVALAHRLHPHPTPLHVDTALDVEIRLPDEVRAECERFVELLWRMSRDKLGVAALRPYHARFLERYGTDRAVPILDLLDPARGLGPPAGYTWPASDAAADEPAPGMLPARVRLLHRMVADAVRDGRREIELDDRTVAALLPPGADAATVPGSCEVTVHVVAPSQDALTAGDFRIVRAPSPGSHQAGATFARFADLLPECADPLADEVAALPSHVRGAVRADLAFRPRSGKGANLAHGVPHSRRRITIGLPDGAGVEEIRLDDVAVGATLERMCAWHVPSGTEIVPQLGNMISPTAQAPNAARLLWEIGLEGQRLWEPWSWGSLADAPFTPRVRYGRSVLAPAIWRLDELRDLSEGDFGPALQRWRRDRDVPDRVLVVSNDQRLLIELDSRWDREVLRDEIGKDRTLVAQEPAAECGEFDGDGIGGSVSEIVVPLSRRDVAPSRSSHTARTDPARTRCGLGGEWLYLKLYGPRQEQDDLVREHLPSLVALAREHGADRWFFLRYTDPDGHHLRVRLHGDPTAVWGRMAPAVGAALRQWWDRGLIGAHRIDEYDPETERYGGAEALTAAEEVFEADSEAAVRLLGLAGQPGSTYSPDALGAISVAALAAAFGAPDPGTPWAGSDDPAAVWLSTTGRRRGLPGAYRTDADRWRRLIDPAGGFPALSADPAGTAVREVLTRRDDAVRRLRRAASGPPDRLVGSLMHMTCNRLYGGDPERERTVVGIARGAVQDNAGRRRHVG